MVTRSLRNAALNYLIETNSGYIYIYISDEKKTVLLTVFIFAKTRERVRLKVEKSAL